MQVIAHRGMARDRSDENTPLAFCRAIIMGFKMMELDARLTKDGQFVVHHDPEISHEGRRVRIREHIFEDLVADGICTKEEVRFGQSCKIPTLKMVLDIFLPQIRINVELKEKGSGKVFVDLLKEMTGWYAQFRSGEILEKLLVSSFEESELIVMKKSFPQIEIALLFANFQFPLYSVERKKLDRLKRFGIEAVHIPFRKASKDLVEYLKHQRDFTVRVYTVNDRENMFCCFDLGVDGVFTDKAEALSWISAGRKSAVQSISV